MTTNNSPHVCETQENNGNFVILRYEMQDVAHTEKLSPKQQILRWFGLFSTLILGTAVFAPNLLHIAASYRPWIFIAFILWLFAFCTGLFNS